MIEQPRTVAIHRSLFRPILLMGAERELVLLSGLLAAVLVFSMQQLVFTIAGAAFWIVGVSLLQRAAKADPILSRVYLRHVRYRPFYEAQSRPSAMLAIVHGGQPC